MLDPNKYVVFTSDILLACVGGSGDGGLTSQVKSESLTFHWSIRLILSSHWSIILILATHWSKLVSYWS